MCVTDYFTSFRWPCGMPRGRARVGLFSIRADVFSKGIAGGLSASSYLLAVDMLVCIH